MKTKRIEINGRSYGIISTEDFVIPGEVVTAEWESDPNTILVVDGKMYPNNPELMKAWDDKIQAFLDEDKIEEAWQVFLTKPNKEDYPWIHHMEVELPEVGKFDLCDLGADGSWNRNQVIKLDYFSKRLKDWIDDEYDCFESFTNGRTHTKVRINSNPEFDKACKKALIENNFGSMEYDW